MIEGARSQPLRETKLVSLQEARAIHLHDPVDRAKTGNL
jgi:hypothetical protein